MLRSGFGPQMTDELKSAYDPDGLYGPLVDYNRPDGDFDGQTLRGSLVTWLDTHPVVCAGLSSARRLARRRYCGPGREHSRPTTPDRGPR
jgi:hypothetical protein